MRRGEVFDYTDPYGGEGLRVVILSADEHIRSAPLAADIVRGGTDTPPYSIRLADVDPMSGYVLLVSLEEIMLSGLGEAPVCTLTGTTMTRINTALRDLLDL